MTWSPHRGLQTTWPYLPAPDPERKIRVYHTVDARLTLEDFFAKLTINYR